MRLLNVAALAEKKGHRFLLEALAELPDATLEIVGDGELRADLEARVRELGLEDRVAFLGERPKHEVARLMREARLFVLPSLAENLPVVLIEAMASGLPSVATRVGGVPEMLGGDDGELVAGGRRRPRWPPRSGPRPRGTSTAGDGRPRQGALLLRGGVRALERDLRRPAQQARQQLAGHQPADRLVRVGLEQARGPPGVGVALGRVQRQRGGQRPAQRRARALRRPPAPAPARAPAGAPRCRPAPGRTPAACPRPAPPSGPCPSPRSAPR